MGFPVCLLVSSFHEKSDVVHKAEKDFSLLLCTFHYSKELTGHVLTTLCSFAELELAAVVDVFVEDCFLELLDAVVVGYGGIVLVVLDGGRGTLVGSRGLPLALSVLGLMRLPGGFPSCFCLT